MLGNSSRKPQKAKRLLVALTTVQMRMLCDQAEALRFSHGPNATFWNQVDPNGQHILGSYFVHRPNLAFWKGVKNTWDFAHGGGKNIRAVVLCQMRDKTKRQYLLCDFDYEAFVAIPGIRRKGWSHRRMLGSPNPDNSRVTKIKASVQRLNG